MNKVTKLLLVAGVAAIGLGGFSACSDSVTVVEPAPPPEPPEIPPVEATVTIQGIRQVTGTLAPGTPVDPTNVDGSINVLLNVSEGDETITSISLVLDGVNLGCQAVSASTGDVQASTAGATDVVECFLKTHEAEDVCVGEQLANLWDNDEHVLGAQIVTAGGTRTAANEQTLTFNNSNYVQIVPFGSFQSVVSAAGIRYYGGPPDLDGDGTDDNVVQFAACPIRFDGVMISEVWVQARTDDGANPADLGDGLGAVQESTSPFIFTVDYEDNENFVEDYPTGQGANGHSIAWVAALDDAGVDVSLSFACGNIAAVDPMCAANDLYVDMTDPVIGVGNDLQLDGAAVTSTWYSEGEYDLTGITDGGAGVCIGDCTQVDVAECDDWAADMWDADVFAADQVDLDGHPEDDWQNGGDGFGAADAGGVECYTAFVQNLADITSNSVDRAVLEASNLYTADYGVDRTEADFSDVEPADGLIINPDVTNDGVCAAGECIFLFTAEDPDLESGDPGSQVDLFGLAGVADGVATAIEVESTDEDDATANHFLTEVAAGDFEINIEPAGLGTGLPADGDYDIEITVPDLATPANEAVYMFSVTLDNTPPNIGALNPAPVGSAGTDASAIVMSIGMTIDDVNIIDVADLTVAVNGTDAAGTGASASCSAAVAANNLYTLSVTGGEIDRNVIDLSNGTNLVDFTGAAAEAFQIEKPASGTVTYCFILDAEDEALDIDGTAAPNVSQLVTEVAVTWN
jgi:hypothetical protein